MKNATSHLNPIPLSEALQLCPGVCYATMSVGQWDEVLQEAYDVGFVLLVLDDEERPVGAYRKSVACS
jgi:hypothetical protein